MKFVVVDDDPKITNLIQVFLEQKGYEVLAAHDGLTGLKLIETECPDFVISDLLLPGLHGLDLCDRVKRNNSLKHIPVILMTGVYTKSKYRIDARRSGADDFIEKPIKLLTLWSKLKKLRADLHPTDDNAMESIRQQIEDLRRDYVSGLPEKIHEIDRLWQECLVERQVSETFQTFHLQVHKLTGSSATFGLNEVSEMASKMDVFLRSSISSKAFPTSKERIKINSFIELLKEHTEENVELIKKVDVVNQIPEKKKISGEEASRLIYLVEIDPLVAEDLALQIGYFGYTIRPFTKPDKLEEALSTEPPAALIVNLDYIDESHTETGSMIDILETWRHWIPCLFISARGDLRSRLSACRRGGAAFFVKPVDVGKLIEKIELLIGHRSPEPLRVLIVEDDIDLSKNYELILNQAGIETIVVNDPMDLMKHLIDFRADLILMDLYMPECSGIDLSAVIRQMEEYVGVPIVFLSSETELEKQLQAMKLGADDFLTKPIEPNHLVSVVTTRAHRSRLLRSFMVRDSLTGLLNHTSLKEQLSKEITRARREESSLSFAMIDIDHFKSINDTYGHSTGDNVLKALSRLLQRRLRKTDIIGRYGGEEFAVILQSTDSKNAFDVIDDIRVGFAKLKHQPYEGKSFSVQMSCGIASYPCYKSDRSINEAADRALYEAKKRGRNQTVLSEEEE